MQDGLALMRELAQTEPQRFLPELARWLHKASGAWRWQGRIGDALAASREAVEHRRTLASTSNTSTSRSELGSSLGVLATLLAELGEAEAAREAAHEALGIYEDLAKGLPAFVPELAGIYETTSYVARKLGDLQAALSSAEHAVRIRREEARQARGTGPIKLVGSLWLLSDALTALGRDADAEHVTAEIVSLTRQLTAGRTEHPIQLVTALEAHALKLARLDRLAEAEACAREGVALSRSLDPQRPETPFVAAQALLALSKVLVQSEAWTEASASLREAVELFRDVVARQTSALPSRQLAKALRLLGEVSERNGESGLEPAREALRLHLELDPAESNDELQEIVDLVSEVLARAGRLPEEDPDLQAARTLLQQTSANADGLS
jgi:tetratricopeptide (TPR) repeat protein